MPLPERLIQPVSLSRGTLQYPVPDELEGVTNGTLANIIRQLSTLSRHAEEMFGNLFKEAEGIATRSSGLQARIDKLAVQVTQLDSTVEEVSLQDIHLRPAFRSSQTFDQQVVSRDTMPKAMLEAYLACDKPPPLNKLNPYRDDGKDGLKFYTDPTYFFELWRQEMLKDTERMMHDKGKKPIGNGQKGDRANKKRVRQPHNNTTEKQRQKVLGHGEYIIQSEYEQQQQQNYQEQQQSRGRIIGYGPALSDMPLDLIRPNNINLEKRPNNSNGGPPGYQGYQYNANQEPIYTPRILRSEQPPSPQREYQHQQQQQMNHQFNLDFMQQHPNSMMDTNYVSQQQQVQQQQQQYQSGSNVGTPTRRPNQPPPAPPMEDLMTSMNLQHSINESSSSNNRDSLPPPPPPPASEQQQQQQQSPMQQLLEQLNSQHQHQKQDSNSSDHLPPPPPVPASNTSMNGGNNNNTSSNSSNNNNNSLHAGKTPSEYLPPSPPPPPPSQQEPVISSNGFLATSSPIKPVVVNSNGNMEPPSGAPPPPPPPPPSSAPGEIVNGFRNGDVHRDNSSPVKTNGTSPPKNILSPQGLKKPNQLKNLPVHDGVRSDLLKAIRDGIALRKVEQNRMDKDDGKAGTGQTDVASILARRVAVEMSDSDEAGNGNGNGNGNTDSEYDSDEWGDESQA